MQIIVVCKGQRDGTLPCDRRIGQKRPTEQGLAPERAGKTERISPNYDKEAWA